MSDLFRQRTAILATMHRKEQAIVPILEPALDVKIVVPEGFDTDRFGTFTREIDRPASQHVTARLKAEAALNLTGETLAIASEGSFGPHPALPYLPCNREIVLLLDRQNQIEIAGEALAIDTNYSQQDITSLEAALAFAQKAGFPSHGLVVIGDSIVKGITDPAALTVAVTQALQSGKARLETDMRALYNPTRMKAIEQATRDLVKKLKQRCPTCSCPGFDIVERKRGLSCSLCHLPTELTRSAIYQCQKCSFTQEILFPDGLDSADPAQCPYCNP